MSDLISFDLIGQAVGGKERCLDVISASDQSGMMKIFRNFPIDSIPLIGIYLYILLCHGSQEFFFFH